MMKIKKKTIANIVMTLMILAILIAGVIGVGHIKGWFEKPSEETALLTEIQGIVTLERDGVAYTVKEDTVLRENDKFSCDSGATAKIVLTDGYITLGQNAKGQILNPRVKELRVEVSEGEAFVNVDSSVSMIFDEKQLEIKEAVVTLSVRKGAQSVYIYHGAIENAAAGQMLEWIGEEKTVRNCDRNDLNDFNIAQIREANESKELVFSNEELDELEAQRWKEREEAIRAEPEAEKPAEPEKEPEVEKPAEPEKKPEAEKPAEPEKKPEAEKPAEPEKEPEVEKEPEAKKPVETKLTCTITIRCDTILNNKADLDPAKNGYVPASGCILPVTTVEFAKGETVFDVLNRVCKQYGIQIEYSWTPMYNSYYIEGINNLYEFDCGMESGWMYKVNGWFPNYGCSSYTLTGGETIVWCYTCKGLGTDVGAKGW